jgi:hypothetical protein
MKQTKIPIPQKIVVRQRALLKKTEHMKGLMYKAYKEYYDCLREMDEINRKLIDSAYEVKYNE